jgi:hypothetical protein
MQNMYNKYGIVSKIGTILSFFLLGFGSVETLFKDTIISYNIYSFHFNMPIKYLLYILLLVIFCGIFWSLRYCWKYYQSKNISISFYLVEKYQRKYIFFKTLQQKYIEYTIYNDTNHNIMINSISVFDVKREKYFHIKKISDIIKGNTKSVFIPANHEYTGRISEYTDGISEVNKHYCADVVFIRYQFCNGANYDTEYKVDIKLSNKEKRMFKKLSEQK